MNLFGKYPRTFAKFNSLRSALIAAFLLCTINDALAYVSVAPTAIFLSDADRTGEIIVKNNSNQHIEIIIDFRYGYPVSDTTGRVGLRLISDISISEPCAAEWIHAYPKKFILYPRQSRIVRFILRPPAGLQDGEYWARPVVTSRIHSDLKKSIKQTSSISATMNTSIETVLALSFRHGKVETGALLTGVQVQKNDKRLIVLPSAIREGNAAYIGYAIARIYDEDDQLVKEAIREVAIYYSLRIRLEFDIHDLPKGTYRTEVEFNTNRPGAEGEILHAPSIVKSIDISLV
jgi:hypothetical protein